MAGYIGNEEANAESFTSDGWFRTGDLGFVTSTPGRDNILEQSGSTFEARPWLTLTGRKKELINRGGEKVSPAEVEAVALANDSVQHAVCFPMPDETYGEAVALAVVMQSEHTDRDVAYAVLGTCRKLLSAYQVPSIVFVLESAALVPRTSTGKIQRMSMLRVLTAAGVEPTLHVTSLDARILSSAPFVAPTTDLEKAVVDIWEKVLRCTGIAVLDDFYELGGTSILAARIAFMVQEYSGRVCTGGLVLQHRSIRNLCTAVDDQTAVSVAASPADFKQDVPQKVEDGRVYARSSSGQEQMLFLNSLDTTSGFYNQPLVLALYGEVDASLLHKSIQAVIGRHDALRSTYVHLRTGDWMSVIADPSDVHLLFNEIDLRETTLEITSPKFERLLIDSTSKPFDLLQQLPIRAGLYKLRSCHVLLVVIHHIATDGWSMNIIQDEIAALYRANADAKQLADVEVSYAAYARWQDTLLKSGVQSAQLDYWKNQLHGLEPLLLPTDFPRPAVQKYDGAMHAFRVSSDILAGLKRLSKGHAATLFMTTMTAFQIQMARLSSMDHFAIGSPAAGRGHRSLERTVGYFVNPVALIADLSDNPTVPELLERVKSTTLSALQNSAVPFAQVVEHAQIERSSSYAPGFQVCFVLQERALDTTRNLGKGLEMKLHRLSSGVSAKFDLYLELFDEGDAGLLGRLEYSTALFSQETVERWSHQYAFILQQLCHSSGRVKDLSMLPSQEFAMLQTFSTGNPRSHYFSAPLMHHAFEAIAKQQPERPCLQFEGATMTYGEVNVAANHMAHTLINLGVGFGKVVGIMLERSFDLVISVLGALKSGGELGVNSLTIEINSSGNIHGPQNCICV